MKLYTVKQVAKLSGVSVRTLHHYDEIGLLRPALIGRNRYRYYGQDELLRLQQILIHRVLGMPLGEIGAVLDSPGFDRLTALRRQRARLESEARRYAELVRTIDRTIADLTGDKDMTRTELYKGFSPEKQAGYEAWLIERFGGDMQDRIALSRKKYEALSDAEKAALNDELQAVETAWAEAMTGGVAPDDPVLDPILRRHREWVEIMWGKPCPPEAYSSLADLHLSHPDFVKRHEAIAVGFSDFHAAAMKAHAKRHAR